jgi:hypothetical protein
MDKDKVELGVISLSQYISSSSSSSSAAAAAAAAAYPQVSGQPFFEIVLFLIGCTVLTCIFLGTFCLNSFSKYAVYASIMIFDAAFLYD